MLTVNQVLDSFVDTEQAVFFSSFSGSVFWILVTHLESLCSSI